MVQMLTSSYFYNILRGDPLDGWHEKIRVVHERSGLPNFEKKLSFVTFRAK